jgi:cytochrome c553
MRRWAAGVAACVSVLVAALPQHARAQDKVRNKDAAPASSAPAAKTTQAADYAQRFATVCAKCHGANGRSDIAGTPVLAGQPSLYAITQLFLFREGRRDNADMKAVAKTLSDDDLRGFADYIGTLPPVPAPAPAAPADAVRMAKGRSLAQQHKCVFCHGPNLDGGQQVPRIAEQKEEYLQATLRGFKSGARPGYTQAMASAVSQVPVEDLDTLAYYAARFSGGTAPGK